MAAIRDGVGMKWLGNVDGKSLSFTANAPGVRQRVTDCSGKPASEEERRVRTCSGKPDPACI